MNSTVNEEVSSTILQHLHGLQCFLSEYFPTTNNDDKINLKLQPNWLILLHMIVTD